jgi:exonuclease SbcC
MLLAQGGFAVFLQAAPDQRAPILEQITGTDIYSRISVKVHQRRGEERNKLNALHMELSGMSLLNDEDKEQLRTKLAERQLAEEKQITQINQLQKARVWLDDLATLQKDLDKLETEWDEFQSRQTSFQPQLKQLDRADKACSLDKDYAHLASIRRQQEEESQRCNATQQKLSQQETALAMAIQAKQQAACALEYAETEEKQQKNIIKKVRELDTRIADKKSQIKKVSEAIAKIENQLESHLKQQRFYEKQLTDVCRIQTDIEGYFQRHSVDSGLRESLADIRSALEALQTAGQQHSQLCQSLAEAEERKAVTVQFWHESANAYKKQREELVSSERLCAQLKAAMADMLCGRTLNVWRHELTDLKDRKHRLDQVAEVLVHSAKTRREEEAARLEQQTLEMKEKKLANEIVARSAKQLHLEREVQHLDTQVALLNRIQSLEAERKFLEDGKPCPLCGATEHPFAQGNIPPLDATQSVLQQTKDDLDKTINAIAELKINQGKTQTKLEQLQQTQQAQIIQLKADEARCNTIFAALQMNVTANDPLTGVRSGQHQTDKHIGVLSAVIEKIEDIENQLQSAQQVVENGRTIFNRVEKQWQEAGFKKEAVAQDCERLAQQCHIGAGQVTQLHHKVLQVLAPFGINNVSMADLDQILVDLMARQKRWQQKQDQKLELEKNLSTLNNYRDQKIVLIEKLKEDEYREKHIHDGLMQECDAWLAQRQALFADKDSDEEDNRLVGAVKQAKENMEKSRNGVEFAHQALTNSQTIIQSLQETMEKRAKALQREEKQFCERLASMGFTHEVDYHAACLAADERKILKQAQENLQKQATELTTLRQDKIASLAREKARRITDQSYEQVRQEESGLVASLKEIQQDMGGIKKQLADDQDRRHKKQAQIIGIEAQKKECFRWDALHELIGSADGKKYRNFAQGLTFELLVFNANRQLKKMTDRYLLLHNDKQPLELNVVDNYQAGEIRSTKNLSGGESFIVSLALALGLSQMASRNVRVDSLFLDEGFGTLDENTLDTALETLANLQQDGKLIGVISHIPALKERIGTQIQVTPKTGGRSRISGPGCRFVNL